MIIDGLPTKRSQDQYERKTVLSVSSFYVVYVPPREIVKLRGAGTVNEEFTRKVDGFKVSFVVVRVTSTKEVSRKYGTEIESLVTLHYTSLIIPNWGQKVTIDSFTLKCVRFHWS